MRIREPLVGLALCAVLSVPACIRLAATGGERQVDWPVVHGGPGSRKYSPLDQINASNVHRLEQVWTYRTGDASPEGRSMIQCNPIVLRGVLYCTSPGLRVFAVRGDTGEEIWSFDPWEALERQNQVNRGVAYWESGDDRRIYVSAGHRLWALDAGTGEPIAEFGRGGWVDLREGLGRDPETLQVSATSPGTVYRDLLIQGSRVPEGERGSPGHIRAYDTRTGEIRWTFHTIPGPGEFGHETWGEDSWLRNGGANAWAGFSLDVERGIVYAPTGSASYDFYGGDRPGANLFGTTLLALNAATGERIWHYQIVHHDIWDYDLPAPPTLVTVHRDGRSIDAVAQITKTGFVFVLDRETGEPLFPVEERPFPTSKLEGEHSWPTQPIPLKPAPFARQVFTEEDVTDISPESRAYVLERLRKAKPGRLFTPLGLEEMVVVPGMNGGGEWGGAAWDPDTGILYVNGNELPYITRMFPKDPALGEAATLGEAVYVAHCAACHGPDLRGDGERFPSLVDARPRLTREAVQQMVEHGRGLMPAFPGLSPPEKRAVTSYVLGAGEDPPNPESLASARARGESPYRYGGYNRFHDQEGYPAIEPPWGTLNAIDLNTGEYVWRVPLGEHEELTARGVPITGTTNYGGPVVTAGGLIFIAATSDKKIRAFDKRTGELLWEAELPTAGFATPTTYMVDGRQYVVVAAGGGRLGAESGDAYVAFGIE